MSISSIGYEKMRLSGLATGMDTDAVVANLMKLEKAPLNKLEQKKQLAEWKTDSYREITNSLRSFKDKFMDVLSPTNYMLSGDKFRQFDITSSDSTEVTASSTASATSGTHTVKITNLATAAIRETGTISSSLSGSGAMTTGVDSDVVNVSGKDIKITLDGVNKSITLGAFTDTSTVLDVVNDLQTKIDTEFGVGKITVSETGGVLNFAETGGTTKITLESGATDDGLSYLKYTSGDSNRINRSHTLETIANQNPALGLTFSSDEISITINEQSFTFSKDDTLSSVMNSINSDSEAKVTMSYDEVTDKITFTAKQMGTGNTADIQDTSGTFFSSVLTAGEDATFEIDGQSLTRPSNNVEVNGIRYTLLGESGVEKTISLTKDVDSIYDSIKTFIDDYNEIIGNINDKLSEKYDRNYQPLTAEEKESFSEDDLKSWEEKAKTGLLRNDSILSKIATDMRKAIYDSVSGVSGILSDVGISTGIYKDKGKLTINEDKLRDAITNNSDKLESLFVKKSDTHSLYSRTLTSTERTTRYNEEGFINRIYDIIEDNTSILLDSDGNKGILLQKAGIDSDSSSFNSSLFKEITDYNTRIYEMTERLYDKEDSYYKRFSAMEAAINKMNSQSSWLSSQMGMY